MKQILQPRILSYWIETGISIRLSYENVNIRKNLLHIFQCKFRT